MPLVVDRKTILTDENDFWVAPDGPELWANDTVFALDGDDVVMTGNGNDNVPGSAGNDKLSGQQGNDELFGGSGDDQIWGGSGNDHLHGGSGNDLIVAGSGNDTIYGGQGIDKLDGGSGSDNFYFFLNDSGILGDTIFGFETADQIFLAGGYGFAGYGVRVPGTGQFSIWQQGEDSVVSWNSYFDPGVHDVVVKGDQVDASDISFFV